MKVDWGRMGNTPIDAGVYEVEVKGWVPDVSKNKNPVIRFQYGVVHPEEFTGRTIQDTITLTEAALWRLGWFVGSCGVKLEALGKMDSESEEFRRVIDACVGRRLFVTVVIDAFDGKPRNKVTDYAVSANNAIEEVVVAEEVPEFIKHRG